MEENDWQKIRISFAGLALQGMLEREQGWISKILSDTMYEKLAVHCVKLADALINELKKNQ